MSVQKNASNLWAKLLPRPQRVGNKYDRGHVGIFAADELTGATRLAATACSRIGSGLVSVLASNSADIYRATLPADIMVKTGDMAEINRVNVLLGGAGGINAAHFKAMLDGKLDCARVFDAAAIPQHDQFSSLDAQCVLTPHEGEFAKAFLDIKGSRVEMARAAAALTGACIVLKGADTIIADESGNCVTSEHASPYLAKAGTGDVLAGMIAGLIAQGMPVFSASCAAVWIHGEASIRFGPGLSASDISDLIPVILRDLLAHQIDE